MFVVIYRIFGTIRRTLLHRTMDSNFERIEGNIKIFSQEIVPKLCTKYATTIRLVHLFTYAKWEKWEKVVRLQTFSIVFALERGTKLHQNISKIATCALNTRKLDERTDRQAQNHFLNRLK